MARQIGAMNEDLAIHQKMDDEPNDVGGLSAEELKERFDRAPLALQKYINEVLVQAINGLDVDVGALAEQLKNHVDIDPNNLTAENIGLLRELADKYGLTDKLAPTVHDALEVLEVLVNLGPETAQMLGLEPTATQDDAIRAIAAHTKMAPATMSLLGLDDEAPLTDVVKRLWDALLRVEGGSAFFCINARYASTGRPAKGLKFTGSYSGTIGEDGTYFGACTSGETLTFDFDPCIGYKPIESVSVVADWTKVVTVDVVLEKDDAELYSITESGDYFVGEDVTHIQVCAVGGGGSGGETDVVQANQSYYNLGAASGGSGGQVSDAEVDLSQYVGRRITVMIGAGGSGSKKVSEKSFTGNPGGESSVTTPDGEVLVRAAGGEGGKGAHRHGDRSYSEPCTITASHDEPDRQGCGVGATVTRNAPGSYSHSFFGVDLSAGVPVFGDNSIVVGAGGGACVECTETGAASPVNKTVKSATGVQGAGTNGTGEGGSGSANAGTYGGNGFAGGSGAVYFKVVT